MDPNPPQISEGGGAGGRIEGGSKDLRILTRCGCSIVFALGLCFFLSFVFGLVALAVGNFTANSPVSVPALCRIISSNVDIKSSKVCELGLLNYKAKHVLYPLSKGKKRFRCHDDYYWASVFEVNETYNCKYTLGSRKADIYSDSLFNCQAKDPSTTELVRRFFILFKRSSIFDKGSVGVNGAYVVAGTVSGMLCGICCTVLLKTLQCSVLALCRRWEARKHRVRALAARFRRACLVVAYFCAAGWLMLEYSEMIGLKQLYLRSGLSERTM